MPLPTNGLEIPIIKLTVESMRTAIMHALDPELLSQQLEAATTKVLTEMNFEDKIRNTMYEILDEILQTGSCRETIEVYLSEHLDEVVERLMSEPDKKIIT